MRVDDLFNPLLLDKLSLLSAGLPKAQLPPLLVELGPQVSDLLDEDLPFVECPLQHHLTALSDLLLRWALLFCAGLVRLAEG
jgi:hypothetical protein